MRLFIIAILMASPIFATSQSRGIQKFFNKYEDKQTSIQVKLPKWLIKTGAKVVGFDGTKEITRKADNFNLMIIDDVQSIKPRHLRKLNKRMEREQFEEIISVKSGDEFISLAQKKHEGATQVFLKFVGQENAGFINLQGNFSDADLERLIDKIEDKTIQLKLD